MAAARAAPAGSGNWKWRRKWRLLPGRLSGRRAGGTRRASGVSVRAGRSSGPRSGVSSGAGRAGGSALVLPGRTVVGWAAASCGSRWVGSRRPVKDPGRLDPGEPQRLVRSLLGWALMPGKAAGRLYRDEPRYVERSPLGGAPVPRKGDRSVVPGRGGH